MRMRQNRIVVEREKRLIKVVKKIINKKVKVWTREGKL